MQNSTSRFSMFLRRTAAFVYDCLLLIAVYFVVTAAAIALNDGEAINHPVYKLFLCAVGFVFFDWFWRHGGQTLGMRAWRIRVESTDGQSISLKQSLIRYVTGGLLFGFTLLYLPFSSTGMALHDAISKTKIIRYYK